jgi:ABC-2 type transport system ATP-binding protein
MIRIERLTKRYGAHTAVDSISFDAAPGAVTGFLGRNGAGKSTTLRMLVGLTPPSSGSATVLGAPYASLGNPGRRVGVLLDAAAQHPGRTGREVLALGAAVMGLARSRADEVLALVGLGAEEGRRRVGDYSLGMRQRLGIGHALLGDPQVLILDEPANGLDPGGIHWMRSLLRRFADRGGTVLLSSHLLHEIEVIADELVIIDRGRVVAEGPKTAMLAGAGTVVRSPDAATLAIAFARAGLQHSTRPDGSLLVDGSVEDVGRTAATSGAVLTELRAASGAGLEETFLQLTMDARDRVPA